MLPQCATLDCAHTVLMAALSQCAALNAHTAGRGCSRLINVRSNSSSRRTRSHAGRGNYGNILAGSGEEQDASHREGHPNRHAVQSVEKEVAWAAVCTVNSSCIEQFIVASQSHTLTNTENSFVPLSVAACQA
eukprot:1157177-Pelagomonas_calceolata.AAC.1